MNRIATILVCIMVAGCIIGASLPIFDSLTASSDSVHNEGAGWVRFDLNTNASATYTVDVVIDEDNDTFTISTNGTDNQTYDPEGVLDFETIIYADSNLSVWVDSDYMHIMGLVDGAPFYIEGWGSLTLTRTAEGVTFGDDDYNVTFDAPTWAYVPWSTGSYGFFAYDEERGVTNYPMDMPLAVVGGGFAGVYAYNDIYRYEGLGLAMTPIYDDDGLFYGASWARAVEPFDPENITPLDPIYIIPGSGDSTQPVVPIDPIDLELNHYELMAVPTPTYTDGDWGYELITGGAKIVSYSGTGGDIVIPSTVGGYTVLEFGKGGNNETVFNNSTISANSSITIPSGITKINAYAFDSVTNIKGDLIIPDSVVSIGQYAFDTAGFDGTLVIPDTITIIPNGAFFKGKFSHIVLPSNLTEVRQLAFSQCYLVKDPLVLPDTLVTIQQYAFATGGYPLILIPNSVTTIEQSAFVNNTSTNTLIIASDLTYSSSSLSVFATSSDAVVLDLSNTVDYSVDRHGINANATVSDNIGGCFGFISVVDVSGGGNGPVGDLIGIIPLVMLAGIVLFSIGALIIRRI